MPNEIHPDVRLALAAIASEMNTDIDDLPPAITGILIAFGAARYGDGCREALRSIPEKTKREDDDK